MAKHVVIFQQMEWLRGLTIKAGKNISEDKLDLVPKGFKNNIRWNLGMFM